MATAKINDIVKRFKTLSELHPSINNFGCGQLDDLDNQDVVNYPYLWVLLDSPHNLIYSEDNGYRAIEFNIVLRIGDKKSLQTGYENIGGIGKDNQLDATSNTFQYMLDFINTISEDSLDMFGDVSLIDDVSIEPFFNEGGGDDLGYEASITLRVKNDKVCINPLTV